METSTKVLVGVTVGAVAVGIGWLLARPAKAATPSASSTLATSAQNAVNAINADPNYCSSVGVVGSAVNSAVHDFKLAWNAANPSNPVPINTGKYEASVAAAITSLLGSAPAGCP
jgi:hypothetical protein